jgi:hypothetical protein
MKFLVCLPLLLIAPTPAGSHESLTLQVSPRSSFAPSNLQVLVRLAPDDDNRSITIEADSEEFFRSSQIPLEGRHAPRSVLVAFRALPGGEYRVTASVFGSRGDRRARAQQRVIVLSNGVGR